MTRRDYELIAAVLRVSKPGQGYARNLLAWNLIVQRFADSLAIENAAFNLDQGEHMPTISGVYGLLVKMVELGADADQAREAITLIGKLLFELHPGIEQARQNLGHYCQYCQILGP